MWSPFIIFYTSEPFDSFHSLVYVSTYMLNLSALSFLFSSFLYVHIYFLSYVLIYYIKVIIYVRFCVIPWILLSLRPAYTLLMITILMFMRPSICFLSPRSCASLDIYYLFLMLLRLDDCHPFLVPLHDLQHHPCFFVFML